MRCRFLFSWQKREIILLGIRLRTTRADILGINWRAQSSQGIWSSVFSDRTAEMSENHNNWRRMTLCTMPFILRHLFELPKWTIWQLSDALIYDKCPDTKSQSTLKQAETRGAEKPIRRDKKRRGALYKKRRICTHILISARLYAIVNYYENDSFNSLVFVSQSFEHCYAFVPSNWSQNERKWYFLSVNNWMSRFNIWKQDGRLQSLEIPQSEHWLRPEHMNYWQIYKVWSTLFVSFVSDDAILLANVYVSIMHSKTSVKLAIALFEYVQRSASPVACQRKRRQILLVPLIRWLNMIYERCDSTDINIVRRAY